MVYQTFSDSVDMELKVSVQYGRVFLRTGYVSCGGSLTGDTGTPNFDEASVDLKLSYKVIDKFSVVNCLLNHTAFRGLSNANDKTQVGFGFRVSGFGFRVSGLRCNSSAQRQNTGCVTFHVLRFGSLSNANDRTQMCLEPKP